MTDQNTNDANECMCKRTEPDELEIAFPDGVGLFSSEQMDIDFGHHLSGYLTEAVRQDGIWCHFSFTSTSEPGDVIVGLPFSGDDYVNYRFTLEEMVDWVIDGSDEGQRLALAKVLEEQAARLRASVQRTEL